MFDNTIDKKNLITDKNGNEIVDLTTSIFRKDVFGITTSNTIRMTEYYQMRADKIAFNYYKTDDGTEYILKYSGISNPFSLSKDDILIIPDKAQATEQMTDLADVTESNENQVKLYYKFTNTDFKSNSASYDALAAKKIPSGVLDPNDNTGNFTVPYISDDGTTAVTIKNGRMYFGGVPKLADKCITNGMTTAEFMKANQTAANANVAISSAIDSINSTNNKSSAAISDEVAQISNDAVIKFNKLMDQYT